MAKYLRVGIVTLPGAWNYGNCLQRFALSQIYESLGFSAVSLERAEQPNAAKYFKRAIKKCIGKKEPVSPEKQMTKERATAFRSFTKSVNTKQIMGRYPGGVESCDLYSVGSDQVWNPNYIKYDEDWYYLSFAKPEQRIALSPSIGLDSLTPRQGRIMKRGLSGFPRLSVRERRGSELIQSCTGRTAEVVCDPTLVLSANEWNAVSNNACTPTKPYVFTYLLGGVGAEAAEVLERVTNHWCIPVIPLTDRQKPNEPDAGPAEFISLIENATHVVTDSFHAAVFSSILQTPLTIVHREGGASMFSRLEQLSQMLGIEEKVYGSASFDLSRAGDYEGVSEVIELERNKFMTFLEGCLDSQLPGWREGTRA